MLQASPFFPGLGSLAKNVFLVHVTIVEVPNGPRVARRRQIKTFSIWNACLALAFSVLPECNGHRAALTKEPPGEGRNVTSDGVTLRRHVVISIDWSPVPLPHMSAPALPGS